MLLLTTTPGFHSTIKGNLMNKLLYSSLVVLLFGATCVPALAGNPDRQGEAGAYELLMAPYAKMAGLHSMNTSSVTGVEAMHLNVAGMGRINKTEVSLGHAIYLQGTGININAFGLAQRVGKNGAFGISLMSLDFGDIRVTTTSQPEGTGATNAGPSSPTELETRIGSTRRPSPKSTNESTAHLASRGDSYEQQRTEHQLPALRGSFRADRGSGRAFAAEGAGSGR